MRQKNEPFDITNSTNSTEGYNKNIEQSLLDFCKKYLQSKRYSNIVKHAKKMASVFGSTYACKQLFSTMKLTKTKLGAQLTDEHLQDAMFLFSSTYHLNFKNFQIKHNMKYRINVFLPVPVHVCCILCCRYELLKSAVVLIKISLIRKF